MLSARCGSRPPRRLRPGRCCSSGSTGARSGSGQCCRSPRQSRPESRRGWTPFARGLPPTSLAQLGQAEEDPELAEALDRWELSLFAEEPYRSEQLREALTALLGGPDGLWAAAVRAAVLLGETGSERAQELERLRALTRGEPAGHAAAEAVRKALVETVAHGDRFALIESLDDALLGVSPRPAGYFAAVAS